jgi:hypothetical protein
MYFRQLSNAMLLKDSQRDLGFTGKAACYITNSGPDLVLKAIVFACFIRFACRINVDGHCPMLQNTELTNECTVTLTNDPAYHTIRLVRNQYSFMLTISTFES